MLNDWAHGWSIAKSAMERHMSESKVDKIRRRLRIKYDGIQKYVDGLPPRKCRNTLPEREGIILRVLYGKVTFLCVNFLLP